VKERTENMKLRETIKSLEAKMSELQQSVKEVRKQFTEG